MTKWARNPRIYEINTWVWLTTLSQTYDKTITLNNIPEAVVDELASYHVDAIWLMGVWTRGNITRLSARNYMHEYKGALPDVTEDDVQGSAYAISAYDIEPALGGLDGLARFRTQLQKRGLKLILDFVPNHTGHNHRWLVDHPDYYVQGWDEHKNHGFFEKIVDGEPRIIANGKDPYFSGWVDTAQLNAFDAGYRAATIDTLRDMADIADGVRCDMAMLMVNRVFQQTWGWLGLEAPYDEYWDIVIPAVKAHNPDFIFIAEVYWDMNWELIQQGFDYTYDKILYDRLRDGDVNGVYSHLIAERAFLERQIRFIENHDELRAADTMGVVGSRPAATIIATLPGATLLHDGQFTGRKIKLPVQISRQPDETEYPDLKQFYIRLLEEASDHIYRDGEWRMFRCFPACDCCLGDRNLVAYGWRLGDDIRLIVVNLTEHVSQARVDISAWGDLISSSDWVLLNVLDRTYTETAGDHIAHNIPVDLNPHDVLIYHFRPRVKRRRNWWQRLRDFLQPA